jgi:hypothetical protein
MQHVFDGHPTVHTIWVVGEQPFLEEIHAVNYARASNLKIEKVEREVVKLPIAKGKGEKPKEVVVATVNDEKKEEI